MSAPPTMGEVIVRARHLAFTADGVTAGQATLYYPADASRLDEARLTGAVPPIDGGPWPVAIILPGINVAPDGYRWLAVRLVEAGCAAVTYSAIGSLGPAGEGITPGIDMAALAPGVVGTRCSAPAVIGVLAALADHADVCDPGRVSLVGHSAGGTVALHNSNPEWIPGLRNIVTYGAHTMTATSLGHGEAAVVPIPARVPVLLLGGAADAVVAASRDRYRTDDGEHDPIARTFADAIVSDGGGDRGESRFVTIAGAHHFSICSPVDHTSGRSFLEPHPETEPGVRDLLGALVARFVAGDPLDDLTASPLIERHERR